MTLVLYMPMDEGTGTKVADLAGGNNGTADSGYTWVAGKYGNAMKFDGTGELIVPDVPNLEWSGGAISFSLWFNTVVSTSYYGYLLSKAWNGMGWYNYRINQNLDGSIFVYLGGNTTWGLTSAKTYSQGTWHHLALVVGAGANGSVQLYIDNTLDTSTNHNITAWGNYDIYGNQNVSLVFANIYPHEPEDYVYWMYEGSLDEVRIFNHALTAAEVSELYNTAPVATLRAKQLQVVKVGRP